MRYTTRMRELMRVREYEIDLDGPVPPHVRNAQRVMLLYLNKGDEIWVAVARSIGLDPALDVDFELENRCLRLGMQWLNDPEVERITEQLQRTATALLRLQRLRAVGVMGKFLDSPIENVRYRAARDTLKNTDPDLERLRGLVAGKPGPESPPSVQAENQTAEVRRLALREKTRKALEGGR